VVLIPTDRTSPVVVAVRIAIAVLALHEFLLTAVTVLLPRGGLRQGLVADRCSERHLVRCNTDRRLHRLVRRSGHGCARRRGGSAAVDLAAGERGGIRSAFAGLGLAIMASEGIDVRPCLNP
jgi:hypothetical protein